MKRPKNFWPYGIILTFVIFISCTVGLVVLACSQKTELVSENYYEQEIRFQSQMEREQRASAEGATIDYDSAANVIRIALPRKQGADLPVRSHGDIYLYRPSASGLDKHLPLLVDMKNNQSIDASKLNPGLWKVRLSWTSGTQEYFLEQAVVVP